MRSATGAISSGLAQRAISIHALHEESDRVHTTFDSKVLSLFQYKISMRRANIFLFFLFLFFFFTIHALHEESDGTSTGQILQNLNFNPRSP